MLSPRPARALLVALLAGAAAAIAPAASAAPPAFLAQFHTVIPIASTVPVSGPAAVETTPSGGQVTTKATGVPDGAGDLFGLAIAPFGQGVYFVNDAATASGGNSLQLLQR